MPLPIAEMSEDRVENLTAMFYGLPGVGKSTGALTTLNPLMLDFDGGSSRAAIARGPRVDLTNWGAILRSLTAADLADYKTVIIDTIGTALDRTLAMILNQGNMRQSNGAPVQAAYGRLGDEFRRFLTIIWEAKIDLVIVAHAIEQQDEGRIIQRIKVTGQTGELVKQKADLIGRIWQEGDQRRLSFNPQFASLGKNMGLPDMVIPDVADNPRFMADVLAQAKRNVNARSDTTRIYYAIVEADRDSETPADLVDALNQLISTPGKTPLSDWRPENKRLLSSVSERAGLVFDQSERLFALPHPTVHPTPVPPDPAPAPAPAPAGDPTSMAATTPASVAPPPDEAHTDWQDAPPDDAHTDWQDAPPDDAPESLF